MSTDRDFKGVWIPKEIWLDSRLTSLDKFVLTEIDSLSNENRGCYASNQYLADFCQCSETKISKAISKLINLGYVKIVKFDGRQREMQSRLAKSARQVCQKCKADSSKVQDINKDNNKAINIEDIKYIVEYLNLKANTHYRYQTETTQNHIKARFKDGFTVEDFKTVIDRKCADWLGNTEMQDFLRPQTLFGTKFESYLNSKGKKASISCQPKDEVDEEFESLF